MVVGNSYPNEIKKKIVSEVKSEFVSHRGAAKKYGMSRNSINNWVFEDSLLTFASENLIQQIMEKPLSEKTAIKRLQK